MTEDEANTKTCYRTLSNVALNGHLRRELLPCIGSACMAWRWISKTGTSEDGKPNYYTGKWKGYCGLAGKP